jgi:quercetin dioxygenase-like cupin family protein
MFTTRRIVTGHDENGKAIVTIYGAAPNVGYREGSGVYSTLLWVTDGAPADNGGQADAADRTIATSPPAGGSILRIVDFPPASQTPKATSNEQVLKELGISNSSGAAASRSPFMHRTRSIDYAIVMDGEITMLLDDSDVDLKTGDVLVQRGTNHAWVNRSERWCRVAFVLIDALPLPGQAAPH